MPTNQSEQQALLSRGILSPPPYMGYPQTGVAYVPHGHPAPVVVHSHVPSQIVIVRHDRRRCRFLIAFLVPIFVFFLVQFMILSVLRQDYWGIPHQWSVGPGDLSPDYPIPASVELISCNEPLRDGNRKTTLSADPSSDTVLLMALGSMLHGSVRITTGKHDSVRFSVALESLGQEKDTIVCSLKRGDGENGVGIFNPRRRWGYRRGVRYDVVVEFPENHPILNHFESNTANSVYTIDDIKDKILFKNLDLRSSNGGISSESIAAHQANIVTSNGHITGYYSGSDHLGLYSSNGRIDVRVDFSQVESSDAILSMATSNGALKADIRLHDGTSRKSGTDFKVSTITTNARLGVSFLEAPLYSTLNYQATTSNSAAEVTLDPTFEGQFSLVSSSLFTPTINQRNVEDPYGKDRRHVVTKRTFRGLISGDVSWGGDYRGDGGISVTTSNGRLTLNV